MAPAFTVVKESWGPTKRRPHDLDIDNLMHPGQAFEHPRNVVDDP
jgi:hypothetical protein